MTKKDPGTPLRGDAAWRAARQEIQDRNEAASARARTERAERETTAAAHHRAWEKASNANAPKQPGRD
jgi:hypothetical protein